MSQPNPQPVAKSDNTFWIYLSYIFGWILSLIGLAVVKDDVRVRFHCAQSLVLSAVFCIFNLLCWIVSAVLAITIIIPILIAIVQFLVWAGYAVYVIIVLVKVSKGEDMRIPFCADFADKNLMKAFL